MLIYPPQQKIAAIKTAGGGDYSNHGTAASVDNIVPISCLALLYPTAIDANFRRIVSKRVNVSNVWDWQFDSGGGLVWQRTYATTNASATALTSSITTNEWQWLGSSFDGTNAPKLYRATLLSAMSDITNSSVAPVGANSDESTADLQVGSRGAANQGFLGSIAFFAIWKKALTLAELNLQRVMPSPVWDCRLFCVYSGRGKQFDRSGNNNHGTLTGTVTAVEGPPGLWLPAFGIDSHWLAKPIVTTQSLAWWQPWMQPRDDIEIVSY